MTTSTSTSPAAIALAAAAGRDLITNPLARLHWFDRVCCVHLPGTACRVAGVIALRAVGGTFWQSRSTIAAHLGCDEARITTAFTALADAGFLLRGPARGPGGRQTVEWILTIPDTPADDGSSPSPAAPVADAPTHNHPGHEIPSVRGQRTPGMRDPHPAADGSVPSPAVVADPRIPKHQEVRNPHPWGSGISTPGDTKTAPQGGRNQHPRGGGIRTPYQKWELKKELKGEGGNARDPLPPR